MTTLQAYNKIDNTCCLNSTDLKYAISKNDMALTEEQRAQEVDCETVEDMVDCLDALYNSVNCLQLILSKRVNLDQLLSLCEAEDLRTACLTYNNDKYAGRCLTIEEIRLLFNTYNSDKVDFQN